jgi:hypothetical protein
LPEVASGNKRKASPLFRHQVGNASFSGSVRVQQPRLQKGAQTMQPDTLVIFAIVALMATALLVLWWLMRARRR